MGDTEADLQCAAVDRADDVPSTTSNEVNAPEMTANELMRAEQLTDNDISPILDIIVSGGEQPA